MMQEQTADRTTLHVSELLSENASHLNLQLITGKEGLQKRILFPKIQKPGLALTGFTEYVRPGRVQILGESELAFLAQLDPKRRAEVIHQLCQHDIACFIITRGLTPPVEIVRESEKNQIPLFVTPYVTAVCIEKMTAFLSDLMAPKTYLHADLIDVFGLGVLLTGNSGIGKSECALDLIVRGHRLVSDDIVIIKKTTDTILVGTSPDLIRYHMELRGLGVINIKDLFGISAISLYQKIELVVSLERWQHDVEYDRLGLDENRYEILGVDLPLVRMPVAPGRNIAILIEVASRNFLLRSQGYNASAQLARKVDEIAGVRGDKP
ncbi:MAG TPA: HPr(Ser) kinase/phosphatase [Acidobacteriota bacterium]|nr:HPr(Ser) kinase/phosphatase [Acidobacteriota bacterium]